MLTFLVSIGIAGVSAVPCFPANPDVPILAGGFVE
jgi:hypothetical protein